jgi:hypothetical protein
MATIGVLRLDSATLALNFGLYCLRVVVIAPPAFTTPRILTYWLV